jgi:hypothetical protein
VTAARHTDPAVTDRDHVAGRRLPTITDEFMRERIGKARPYTVALLLKTASHDPSKHGPLVWEHGRRNMALQADGVLAMVLPASDDSDWAGIGVFDASPEEVRRIIDADPGIQAGIFSYEIHPVRGFPGSK